MAIAKRFAIAHESAFRNGALLRGGVEPVADFNAEALADGSRPQQRDKETGLPLWQCTVIDMDDDAGRRDIGVSVKFAAAVEPTVPKNNTPFPWTPVRFEGLTVLPYIEDSGNRPRSTSPLTKSPPGCAWPRPRSAGGGWPGKGLA